jgi:hypothetical protein
MNPWEAWKKTPYNNLPKELREEIIKDLIPDLERMKKIEEEANMQSTKSV